MKRFRFHLSPKSTNAKTGPIPVSTTSQNSCPDHCPFAGNGCYAENYPLKFHWQAVSRGERGGTLKQFCAAIASLADGTLWRHNQAGDLPGQDDVLDADSVRAIADASKGKRGFTYTHYPPSKANNAAVIKDANERGFTVNLSADSISEADSFKALGIGPVTVVMPSTQTDNVKTPAGHLVVMCPAQTRDDVTCATCKLCAWRDRDVIIGFQAHGARAKKAELVTIKG